MEREPMPIVSLPGSILALAFVGSYWILVNEPIDWKDLIIVVGAGAIIINPLISQILHFVWKLLGGFAIFDYSIEFYDSVPRQYKWVVQTIFDKHWHGEQCPPGSILEYSRRRSSVCQMNLFAILAASIGFIAFSVIMILLLATSNCSDFWQPIIFLVIYAFLFFVFWFSLNKNKKELYEIEKNYLDYKKIKQEIDKKILRERTKDAE